MRKPIGGGPLAVGQTWELPNSVQEWLGRQKVTGQLYLSDEEKMALAVRLSGLAVELQTGGGPFGAAIFGPNGVLLSVGVNLVVPLKDPTSHGEMVAIRLATQAACSYSLGLDPSYECTMATSAAPCGMCLTGIIWGGIKHLLFGATQAETEHYTGFDEGVVPGDWQSLLTSGPGRLRSVRGGILGVEACKVLADYKFGGGRIYNGSGAASSAVQ